MLNTHHSTVCTVACLMSLAGVACSTPTTVQSQWKNPTFSGGPLRNVLVVGARLDDARRRTLEDGFVTALGSHGVHATPSYTLFPGPLPDGATAQSTISGQGFDGVIISAERGVKERTYVEPGVAWGGGLYADYWGPAWTGPAGYVQTDTFVKFETTVWSPAAGGQMIWSAVTQTENPTSGKDFTNSLLKEIVPSMGKAGIIPQGTGPRVSSLALAP